MKTIIILVIAMLLFFYTCKTKISFRPFSISMECPYIFLGWVCLGIGVTLFGIGYDKIGYKRGVEDARDVVLKVYEEGKTKK